MATQVKKTQADEATMLVIPQMELGSLKLLVSGKTQLVCQAFSEKAKRTMLGGQTKAPKQGREARDPQADYEACFYYTDDGHYAMPSVAFKKAAIRAATDVGMKMTDIRRAFFVNDEYVRIYGEPHMRNHHLSAPGDLVRNANGVADLRFRPEWTEWAAVLDIEFNTRVITKEQIINLFNVAGFGVGIGEWRPEKSGGWGRFYVVTDAQLEDTVDRFDIDPEVLTPVAA